MAVSQALTVTEIAYSSNVAENTSRVRILWTSTQTGDSRNEYTRTAKYYISINGGAETEYSVNYTLPQNTTKTIVDTIITVPHRDDGTGSVSVRTWMDTSISAGVVERSKSITLHPIPRASTITAAYATTLGSNCRVVWTPLSASLWYTIKFTLGSWSYTIPAFKPGVTSSYTYTSYSIPRDVANQFPNDPSGTMTATLYTYETETSTSYIGSPSSQTFTVTLPEDAYSKPSITMALAPVTPYSKFSALYLQGLSKVKATFTGSGQYNASIVSYDLQVDGKTYSVNHPTVVCNSNEIFTPGEITVTGTVRDSRGFTNKMIQKITITTYKAPYIERSQGYQNVICERYTKDNIPSDSGTYLHIKGSRVFTKINGNTCAVRCRYKSEYGSWSHNDGDGVVILEANASTDDIDVVVNNVTLDTRYAYTIEINLLDDTNIIAKMEYMVASEAVDFELREGGKGASFGKHATKENTLECDWDAEFNKRLIVKDNEVVDFVVDQGTSGIWEYRKWYSGKVECWGKWAIGVILSAQWGSLYRSKVDGYAFPSGLFTSAPKCQVTLECRDTPEWAWLAMGGETTKDYTPSVIVCSPVKVDAAVGYSILYYALGNWK